MPGQKYFYPCNWLQILENTMDAIHTAFLHTIVSGAVFTDEFGVLPELEFAETPVGIIYIATRRVGDNIWARMVENVLPNLQQVAPIWETGQQAHPFSGPMMSRWIVPLDDTNTMLIELRHVSETEGVVTPDWWADRGIMLPGQLAADTYEESQRRPADFEAQVSQRPIAVHGLEHLGTTDRGITMFRNQIRRGIRAVKAGSEPGRPVPRWRCGHPDLLQRHGRARAAGEDAGAGQEAAARDRATAGPGLHRGAAADGSRRIAPRDRNAAASHRQYRVSQAPRCRYCRPLPAPVSAAGAPVDRQDADRCRD